MSETATPSGDRFLTFRSEGRLYAVPAEKVAEVVRMTALARVPQAPKCLLGLANLRGAVMPVAGMRSLLGRSEIAASDKSRLVVMNGAAPVALVVDEVAALVGAEMHMIASDKADPATDAEPDVDTGGGAATLLDIGALLAQAFPRASAVRKVSGVVAQATAARAAPAHARRRLIVFDVAGQEYGLSLDALREIVLAPDRAAQVPGSDDAVRGVMAYRDGLLPLLSLRVLLGFADEGTIPGSKIIVTLVADTLVGLIADGVRSIVSVEPQRIEPAPKVLSARAGGEAQIAEIYRAGRGRLISILVPETLFRGDVMQHLAQSRAQAPTPDQVVTDTKAAELRFLVFSLDGHDFALPIDAVDEVRRVPEQITRLPKTPDFLEGVVNLRGVVLPILDQRRRFDMTPSQGGTARRLVVLTSGAHRAGLIVDSVTDVLRCAAEAVQPAPEQTSNDLVALVRSVINLDASGRMLLLLDPTELLSRAERALLDSLGTSASVRTLRASLS